MNVTNRRKSTDTETPPSTQTQQHHQQLIAYITCRQAATVSGRGNQSHQEGDQEQLVTSTSTDSLLPLQAEGEGEEVSIVLDAVDNSSTEHITSSTQNYDFVNESLDEMVMPSTSENASLEGPGTSSSANVIHTNSSSNNNRSIRSFSSEMVARDINKTLNDVSGRGNNRASVDIGSRLRDLEDQSTSSGNSSIVEPISSHIDKNKIILKLPKISGCESHIISTTEDDTRKVEPLKINLHNTQHHQHSSSGVHHTPKITIKPILKENITETLVSSEECSSSAEDEMVSKLSNTELHILPKLTIRAKNEDYGSAQTSVVPKLTIKINDSNPAESLSTASAAANTPPLPKLTIKTGQDGQPESIITNVSPASSTTSSSSSMASSNSSSSVNFLMATSSMSIPKLTIKPLQKLDPGQANEQHPGIPKLCIKTNKLCTDTEEEPVHTKIPKLTIKTGQEHAVIITQHSDNVKSTGIPKMTIKTKSLDTLDEMEITGSPMVEKIPKLTIKTSATNELSTKICINKVSSGDGETMSPKHTASKIGVSRHTNQKENVLAMERIETESSGKTLSTEQFKKVAKASASNRLPSTEDSCISDDLEDEFEEQIVSSNKTVPKLTIKNVGSPQQKIKFVVDSDPKSDKMTVPMAVTEDVDDFNDLLTVDNVGGESSNSQEFCGFNDNINDCSQNKEIVLVESESVCENEVPRRQSDDMDIDETLRDQHEPKMFQNVTHIDTHSLSDLATTDGTGLNGKVPSSVSARLGDIIDTVDLTSSAGSSPSQRFDYNDVAEEDTPNTAESVSEVNTNVAPSTNILLECLQRDTSVIQNTQQLLTQNESNQILPPLQPKPPNALNKSPASLKYPQLAERLLAANGPTVETTDIRTSIANTDMTENIIDSIEILDTPEGSRRNSLDNNSLVNEEPFNDKLQAVNGLHLSEEHQQVGINNNSLNLKRHISEECKETNDLHMDTSDGIADIPSKLRKLQDDSCQDSSSVKLNSLHMYLQPNIASNHQRIRKQKHEHLLQIPLNEVDDVIHTNSNESLDLQIDNSLNPKQDTSGVVKKRGRPRKSDITVTSQNAKDDSDSRDDNKSRKVQLLRKRLAIDMVNVEQPITEITDNTGTEESIVGSNSEQMSEGQKRERSLRTPLRTSRRSNTPISFKNELKITKNKSSSALTLPNRKTSKEAGSENEFNHFLESNSSVSSVSSNCLSASNTNITNISNSVTNSMNSQIDLTISSSSSNSNGSTTNTVTTVEATTIHGCTFTVNTDSNVNGGSNIGCNSNNSMLPPTTILSSSDPLPDVIFKQNDFSSIIVTQQLRGTNFAPNQEEERRENNRSAENSEDDSASSSSLPATPGRSRGRMRGSRGRGSGRGNRFHNMANDGLNTKSLNRPRCPGALKQPSEAEGVKELYNSSPQVFEEDTRMSADLSQTTMPQQQQSPSYTSQPEFFTNEESQSSIISNTSILDPSSTAQVGASAKKPIKKKKMEVCVSEDADFTVASIAEYDWPPSKGSCPSKNRDTFMIQEQVAMYLGIKSFKRKYPDLPRRQVDMEERNWLQEKGLVSEKMCDLGITAVWASDILDIMYTDFYDKYEEYKDFVRQKHLREIEAKQKSLGLNVAGRGLQARERALLSTSKWNSYFNRTRKEERLSFLDLQTLVVNKPSPSSAPLSTIPNRPVAEAVALAAKKEHIDQPPTLLKPRVYEPMGSRDIYYPLSLVPGQFCEKYHIYTPSELRCMPLNTVLDPIFQPWHGKETGINSSDTDSAIESIDKTDINDSSLKRRHNKRLLRRKRQLDNHHNDEFKVPPIPGAPAEATSSSESSSSSDSSSSETDTDSSCSSSSSDESSGEEDTPATCEVCLRPHNRNLNNLPELFVQCYTCRRKVHPSCIEMPHRMSLRVRNYNWQCAECKCCVKCKSRQDQNKMLFCEQCDRGYHIYCLEIKAVPDGRWSCNRCSICMRCGVTKPEGYIPQTKQKKVKWVNEYRVDHITKIKEHYSMLCIPCGRMKSSKRVQIACQNNTTTFLTSPCSISDSSSNSLINSTVTSASSPQPSQATATSCGDSINSLNTKETNGNCAVQEITTSAEDSCSPENKDPATYSLGSSNFTSSVIATTTNTTTVTSTHNTTGGPPPVVA
ncbi:PHD finger protein enhancer of yellow 3 [Haematobia irritans]|uniref:PHD finger protein enhancer of yellow 3 n=1 Tax=Haematobia irritans TaxID=7368 RepID=UPI003F502869